MKRYKILFLILVLASATARAQCGYDSIGGGGSGVAESDTAVIGPISPRCTQCITHGCVAWQLPSIQNDTVSMNIYLYSNSGNAVSIQITRDCDFLLWDTCLVLPPGPTTPAWQPQFTMIGNAQILVCGNIGDTIMIDVKITPMAHIVLDTPILDLTTCSTPVGVLEPLEAIKSWWSLDCVRGRVEREILPLKPGMYFESYDETFSGRGRMILVR